MLKLTQIGNSWELTIQLNKILSVVWKIGPVAKTVFGPSDESVTTKMIYVETHDGDS